MLHAFVNRYGRLVQVTEEMEEQITLREAAWIDLVRPSEEERAEVEATYRDSLPEPHEVEEIEATARFYEDESGLHLNSYFLHRQEDVYRNSTVAFTLLHNRLITLHDFDLAAFRVFRLRARREAGLGADAMTILLNLIDTKLEELADILEEVHTALEDASYKVLEEANTKMEDAIDELARQEDLNGKVRLCLMDTQRALRFLLRRGRLTAAHVEEVREMMRDIDSLLSHNNFLFDKVNFLMDAAQGFITTEQNQIIKIFSIAAVVFLPPTMIASIYGMNFQYMPELDWHLGYPVALCAMVVSGVAPYLFFKYKGWL